MIRPGAVLAGAWAALRAPWWLEGDRLSTLLRPPAEAPGRSGSPARATQACARISPPASSRRAPMRTSAGTP